MRMFLLPFLLLVGLNHILARYVPWHTQNFDQNNWWNRNDRYSSHLERNLFTSAEELENIFDPFTNHNDNTDDGLFDGNIGSFGFDEVFKPGSEENAAENDDNDDETKFVVKKRSEEGQDEEEEDEGFKISEETLKRNENDEEEEYFSDIFRALMEPFVFGQVTPASEENVDPSEDDNKIHNSGESKESSEEKYSAESRRKSKSSEEKTIGVETSSEENKNDASAEKNRDLSILLSQISDIEDLAEIISKHHQYTDDEMLAKPVDGYLAVVYSRGETAGNKAVTRVTDSGEGYGINDDRTTTAKNESDNDDDNYDDYEALNNFTTTETNSDEDYEVGNHETTTTENNSDEDDDNSDDRTTTSRNERSDNDDNELNLISVEFHGIDDADSTQNLNKHKYDIVAGSASELTPTSAPLSSSKIVTSLSPDEFELFQEYFDIIKDLRAHHGTLHDDELNLGVDVADIITSNYDYNSLNKFEKDIRVLHENLDKTKGYLNALQNLHSKIYLRKLVTAAMEEIGNKSKI